jgi:hypothetical protein
VTGGPVVHVDRCVTWLDRGAAAGYQPGPDAIDRLILALHRPGESRSETGAKSKVKLSETESETDGDVSNTGSP